MPQILSPKPSATVEALILSTTIQETHSHFFKGTSYPCQGKGSGECPFRHVVHPPRRKYYLAGLKLPGRARCLVEITDHGFDWLFAAREPGPWMRGQIIKLTRGKNRNSAVVGNFRSPLISKECLTGKEPDIDVVAVLKALWGNPDALDEEAMGKFADAKWFLLRDAALQEEITDAVSS